MSILLNHYIQTLIFIIIFYLIKSQINVLGPPSIVQKVKELENGSKEKYQLLNKYKIYRN